MAVGVVGLLKSHITSDSRNHAGQVVKKLSTVSRSENGIKVMIYMTMILALLIIVFKKRNKISSYKIAKLRFEIQLDNLLMREIVVLCGGDPNNAIHLWDST